jgi:cytochrome P450
MDVPPVDVDFASRAFVDDPYPTLKRLREQAPVFRNPLTGSWILSRHQDVLDALADPRFANAPSPRAVLHARNRDRYLCASVANNILPFMDEPRHPPRRKFVARTFHEYMKVHAPDIAPMARRQLDRGMRVAAFDVLHDFATPLSVSLLCRMLGVDDEAHGVRIKRWSEWFFYLFSVIPSESVRQQLDGALREFRDFFRQVMADRAARPGDDLISGMLAARDGGESMTEDELLDTCLLLLADGVNADHAIANAVAALLSHPDAMHALRNDPGLMPTAVDELLRFAPSVLFIARMATEDVGVDGHTLRKNTGVLLMLAGANRDGSVFAAPDSLDLARAVNPHLTFGKGQHTCIGRPLVKLMLHAALEVLLQRPESFELAEPALAWTPRPGHRWLARLPVTRIVRA